MPTDDLVLLACDGLWDVMSTTEAVDLVREIFESGETSTVKVAEELLDISLDKGRNYSIIQYCALLAMSYSQAPRTISVRW